MSAVIGGTAEALGGGKPARLCRNNALANARIIRRGGVANGAVTGAYVMMLNHLAHQGDGGDENKKKNASRPDDDKRLTFGEVDGWWKWGEGQPLYVDIYNIDFGNFSMDRFNNPEFVIDGHPGVYVRFESSDYVNR